MNGEGLEMCQSSRLTGFRYAYQRLTITAIGNEVIGPNEVRRFLGGCPRIKARGPWRLDEVYRS
jgi:hypothetical protein